MQNHALSSLKRRKLMKKVITVSVLLMVLISACGGAPATQPPATAVPTVAVDNHDSDFQVAVQMSSFLYAEQAVGKYYNDGTTAMALVTVDTSTSGWFDGSGKMAAPPARPLVQIENVPSEFLTPLPQSGTIAAPGGACPAAANPSVQFQTAGGNTVTPDLIAQKGIQTIPTDMVTMLQSNPGSLVSTIDSLVQLGDQRLATADGWNQLLWDKLQAMQVPAESLMDYQLWNASSGIEQQITNQYLQRLQAAGAPPIVINAFNASNKSGWYANILPTPEDALAKMDIQAVLTGSLEGTVQEQRSFTIPGAGQTPIYGSQTGDGTVTWNHPTLGAITFDVNILLDQFDEQGRAIGGTVSAVSPETGYEIRFTFLPDGTKKGELLRGGEVVGLMTMTTNAEKFENYIDLKTNESDPMP
jgi:hypothetical protein